MPTPKFDVLKQNTLEELLNHLLAHYFYKTTSRSDAYTDDHIAYGFKEESVVGNIDQEFEACLFSHSAKMGGPIK